MHYSMMKTIFIILGVIQHVLLQQQPGGTVVSGSLSGRQSGNLNNMGKISGNSAILGDIGSGSKLSGPPRESSKDKASGILDNSVKPSGNLNIPADVIMEPNMNDINPPYRLSSEKNPMKGAVDVPPPPSQNQPTTGFSGFVNSQGSFPYNPADMNTRPNDPNILDPFKDLPGPTNNKHQNMINNPNNRNTVGTSSSSGNMQVSFGNANTGEKTASFSMGTSGKVVHKFLPTTLFEEINSVNKKSRSVDSVPIASGMRNPGPSISVKNIFDGTNSPQGGSVVYDGNSYTLPFDPNVSGSSSATMGSSGGVAIGTGQFDRNQGTQGMNDPFASLRNQIVPDAPRNPNTNRRSMISAPVIDSPTNPSIMSEMYAKLQNERKTMGLSSNAQRGNAVNNKQHRSLDNALGMFGNNKKDSRIRGGQTSNAIGKNQQMLDRALGMIGKVTKDAGMGKQIMSNNMRFIDQYVIRCRFKEYRDPKTGKINPKYYNQVVNGEWEPAKCAPGSGFNQTTCQCSDYLDTSTTPLGCEAEVSLNFNNGMIENSSPHQVSIVADGVNVKGGSAYLNGSTHMSVEYFKAYDLQDKFQLEFSFKADSSNRDTPHPLVSNCVKDNINIEPSVGIILNSFSDVITFVVKTTNNTVPKYVTIKIDSDRWNNITYVYDGKQLTGSVNGRNRSIPVEGNIENRDADLVFGHCERYGSFKGQLDDINIFTCLPNPMESSNPLNYNNRNSAPVP